MLAFKTLSLMYLKYIMIIIFSLCSFMVGFDLMENGSVLPPSANLVVIYIVYKSLYAFDMMLPISLVFAFLVTLIELIRSNALAAYYAIGYSKFRLFSPFLVLASSFILFHIALHATNFSKVNEYAENLRETSQVIQSSNDLFFTYEGNYIYFGTLYPLRQEAKDIWIFNFKEGLLVDTIRSDAAHYEDDHWTMHRAHVIHRPLSFDRKSSGIIIEDKNNLKALKGFRPKILDQVYEGKANYTIIDGIEALRLLSHQNIDVAKITTAMYRIFITPWFALILIMMIYSYAPVSSRFLNVSLFSFMAILATLIVWGLLFMLGELGNTKTLTPEVGVIAPIILLFGVLMWRLRSPLRQVRIKSR